MMDKTPRWALPMLFAGQAQKEIFHNEALTLIDTLLHGRAESADLSVPPVTPEPGQCWVVPAGASGAWEENEGDIACWTEGGWRFLKAKAGLFIDLADKGHAIFHDGSQWRDAAIRNDGLYVEDERVVSERQPAIAAPFGGATIDGEARATIAAILAALRNHGLIAS